MGVAGGISREARERLAQTFAPADVARAEAEVALGRAALKKRHYDILSEHSREAAIAARAALGTPDFAALFERAKALRRASLTAHRSFARSQSQAQRMAAALRSSAPSGHRLPQGREGT